MIFNAPNLNAQDEEQPFFDVAYMKTTPGHYNDYVAMETGPYKKLHKKRQEAGQILGWFFYRVVSPRGTDAHHNFVTVTAYASPGNLEAPWSEVEKLVSTAGFTSEDQKHYERTNEYRDLRRGEVYQGVVNLDVPEGRQPRYWRVNYMKTSPMGMGDWIDLETKNFMPVHKAAIKNNKMDGWGVYALHFPWGEKMKYNATTVDIFSSMEQMYQSTREEWESVHGTGTGRYIMEDILKSRSLVISELWELVDMVPFQ